MSDDNQPIDANKITSWQFPGKVTCGPVTMHGDGRIEIDEDAMADIDDAAREFVASMRMLLGKENKDASTTTTTKYAASTKITQAVIEQVDEEADDIHRAAHDIAIDRVAAKYGLDSDSLEDAYDSLDRCGFESSRDGRCDLQARYSKKTCSRHSRYESVL